MRRPFLILGGLFAGTALVLAALPWWLGAALRRAAAPQGATFSRYERIGYARFALYDVEVDRPEVKVAVARLEAPTPLLWAWRQMRGSDASVLQAGVWSIEVHPLTPVKIRPSGWVPLRARLVQVAQGLNRWLPRAEANAGEVRWPGGALRLGAADWQGGTLKVSALGIGAVEADVVLTWSGTDETFLVALTAADAGWQASAHSQAATITTELTAWTQVARGEASFAATGWLPESAEILAAGWQVDGTRINLGDHYRSVAGDARITWREGRLDAVVTANGEPVPDQPAPPLSVALRGAGTLEAFTLSTLEVRIPGVSASLSAPVTIDRARAAGGIPSRFLFEANLAELPWGDWRGTVRGEADVVAGSEGIPVVDAALTLAAIGYDDWEIAEAAAQARLEWPRLRLNDATLVSTGGSRLTGHGEWDFQQDRLTDAAVTGAVDRAALARWLPPELGFSVIAVEATAAGVWPEIVHEGRASLAELTTPTLKPLAAEGAWRGRGRVLEGIEVAARAGGSVLTVRGSLDATELRLGGLELTDRTGRKLALASPARLSWNPGPSIRDLRLQGTEAAIALSLASGADNRIALELGGLDSTWLEDWIVLPGPAWELNALRFNGTWSAGPLDFSASAMLGFALSENRTASIELAARGDAGGIIIENLHAAEGGAAVIRASGRLPIVLQPSQSPRVRVDGEGALALSVTSEPAPVFWEKLAELTGVTLRDPLLSASLAGTWSHPEGELRLSAQAVTLDKVRWSRPLPEVGGLLVRMTGDGDGINLDEFHVAVAGQTVRARGRLPLVPARWTEAREDPWSFLEQGADLRIEIPDAEMSALARYVPGYLAPVGRLRADVTVKPGAVLSGFVRLQDAASRPLGPLGVLQEIGADIRFEGRRIELRSVTARAGGQPVVLSGTVALSSGGEPRLDLTLRGNDLPFVRQTGLLVRGDLDLKLETLDGGRTRISGTTRLRDSLFLSDVRSFVPRGGRAAGAARRPPYFSVETPPLNAWLLDVEVQGDRFLRLRTPVFNGSASARFRLAGTLGEPRAIGEATINEGQITLPFAAFDVQGGSVRLTEADPYEPRLALTGTARRFGYDLRLNLAGTVSNPDLSFTSSPPLESEQVLLMVMAGEAPGDEVRYSGGQRAVRFGTYLGQGLLTRLGGDAAQADRLSLTTGERVSRQGRETYGFEYKLDSRWSLVGEYDEFDDFNAGIKWRILAREEEHEVAP